MPDEDLKARVAVLETLVHAFGPTARQVIEAGTRLEALDSKVDDVREDLQRSEDVMHESLRRAEARIMDAVTRVETSCAGATTRIETSCNDLAARLNQDRNARISGRAVIIAAMITGTAGTLYAVVEKVLG